MVLPILELVALRSKVFWKGRFTSPPPPVSQKIVLNLNRNRHPAHTGFDLVTNTALHTTRTDIRKVGLSAKQWILLLNFKLFEGIKKNEKRKPATERCFWLVLQTWPMGFHLEMVI